MSLLLRTIKSNDGYKIWKHGYVEIYITNIEMDDKRNIQQKINDPYYPNELIVNNFNYRFQKPQEIRFSNTTKSIASYLQMIARIYGYQIKDADKYGDKIHNSEYVNIIAIYTKDREILIINILYANNFGKILAFNGRLF